MFANIVKYMTKDCRIRHFDKFTGSNNVQWSLFVIRAIRQFKYSCSINICFHSAKDTNFTKSVPDADKLCL